MHVRLFYWLIPTLWMGLIFISSATPYEHQDVKPFLSGVDLQFMEPLLSWIEFSYNQSVISVEAIEIEGVIEFFLRKGAHVGVFFILTCLFYVALAMNTKWKKSTLYISSVMLTAIYAVFDELHQGITPNRTPYAGDVMLDMFGAILAVAFIAIYWKIRKKYRHKK